MLLEEGASPQQVDAAIEKFGFAMGPFRMSDLAGNDISWHIRQRHYAEHPKQRKMRIADRVCELGRFGQKSGLGWYRYEAGKREAIPDPVVGKIIDEERKALKIVPREIPDTEIVDRLLYALVNEGAHILQEGIAQRASDIDVVYLAGYGFPVQRGGPMFYASRVGLGVSVRVRAHEAVRLEAGEAHHAARGGRKDIRRCAVAKRRRPIVVDAVIVSTARTALAKSWRGAFNLTHGATLGAHAVKHAMERAKLDPAAVEDVLMGCANPEGATGFNIARQIALRAGCPVTTSGMTVNRYCSSGLQTIALAAQRIIAGEGEVYVAGGVESISCVQNEHLNTFMAKESWLEKNKPAIYWTMLQTAETVASRYQISREAQDRYGVQSQQRAAAAQAAGRFADGNRPYRRHRRRCGPRQRPAHDAQDDGGARMRAFALTLTTRRCRRYAPPLRAV